VINLSKQTHSIQLTNWKIYPVLIASTLLFACGKSSPPQESPPSTTPDIERQYNWQSVNNGLYNGPVHKISFHPLDTTDLLALTHRAGVFRSQDSGDSWSAVNQYISKQIITLAVLKQP